MIRMSWNMDWEGPQVVIGGCVTTLTMFVAVAIVAVCLDLVVRWLERRGISHELARLLHAATLVLAVLDISLVLIWAFWQVSHEIPPLASLAEHLARSGH